MSRAIKFRAWDEKNRQFADYEDIEECLSCQAMDGWRSPDGIGCCFGINAVEILADCIIEQYTGLKDKNGKEIYEGDIVKVVNVHDGDEECWEQPYGPAIPQEVKWNEELLRWSFGGCRRILCVPEDFEVIGNIHEDPELLEDK